jgi:hypothetical protein
MPRDRRRLTLESGPMLDLAKLIPSGAGKPGTHINAVWTYTSGEAVRIEIRLDQADGSLSLWFEGRNQFFWLCPRDRHFGGQQWYVICPKTSKRVRVLYKPGGAPGFASRHAWGRRAAYASQFLDPIGRAWRTKTKVKARVLGDADPDEWDLPPRPKHMRRRTYQRWEAKYDAAEGALDDHLCLNLARLMSRK